MIDLATTTLQQYNPSAPSQQELVDSWRAIYAPLENEIMSVRGLLGVIVDRPSVSQRFLSVDMCEIVRQTHYAFAAAMGHSPEATNTNIWSYDGYGISSQDQPKLSALLINRKLVMPVPEIATIRRMLQTARRSMLIIANTSSAEGTELATIEFLQQYLPNCFDGILFPRNYDGTGAMTKGRAIAAAMQTIGVDANHAAVAHIDDAPHHNRDVIRHLRMIGTQRIRSTMPLFKQRPTATFQTVHPVPNHVHTADTVVEAIAASVEFLRTTSAVNSRLK